ncbi:MAG: hypothetical protein ACLPJJ_10590, partial [Acidocella sp.]|uniref:hypothetical protein n=1 Tax=Acidocella sp. TaxID=50710 RepID=UPI003FD708B7
LSLAPQLPLEGAYPDIPLHRRFYNVAGGIVGFKVKTDAPGIAAELAPLHLKPDDSTCDIVKSPMQRNIRICTLKR